jgi:DNA-binding GntR family transcriptional regulator
MSPDVLDGLRPLAAAIEEAAARRDLITHVAADMEFHLRLLALAGNQHLVETVRSLRARSRIYGLRTLAERDALVPSAHEHAELLDLIVAGDADAAEHLMDRHIRHVRGIWAE